jgi:hypothetical protein
MMRTAAYWVVASAIGMMFAAQRPLRADYETAVLADNPVGYWRFNDETAVVAGNWGTAGDAYNGSYIGGSLVPATSFTLVDGRQVTGLGGCRRVRDGRRVVVERSG